MKVSVNKLMLLYCICRQAERSLDFAIQSERGLDKMRLYYEGQRLLLLEQAMASFASGTAEMKSETPVMKIFARILRVAMLPAGLIGRWRWYGKHELQRLQSAMLLFRCVVRDSATVSCDELIRLRMILYSRQLALRSGTLLGRNLEVFAQRTEHFGQNDRMEFMTIKDLLTPPKSDVT